MRILGALLVMLASGSLGLTALKTKRGHIRVLRELSEALGSMEREIRERLTPLPQILRRLSEGPPGAGARFAALTGALLEEGDGTFSLAWERGLAGFGLDELCGEERKRLLALGKILGRYGAEGQCVALRQAGEQLRLAAEEAESELRRSEKLYLGGGLSLGAMTVLLLI